MVNLHSFFFFLLACCFFPTFCTNYILSICFLNFFNICCSHSSSSAQRMGVSGLVMGFLDKQGIKYNTVDYNKPSLLTVFFPDEENLKKLLELKTIEVEKKNSLGSFQF